MTTPLAAAALLVTALVVAACSGSGADAGTGASATQAASFNAIEQPVEAAAVSACGEVPEDLPGWSSQDLQGSQVIPVIASSLVSVGPTRFLYTLTDAGYRVITAPEVESSVAFYALGRDAGTPAAQADAAYLDTQLGRGLYRASADLDCAGEWGAEVRAALQDGSVVTGRVRFTVHPQGTTPAIGDPAPRSASATASTLEELRLISTDPNPFPGAYERTVAEVVTSGQPSLVFFATPAFCQTGYCGPTVNLVKSVAIDYRDQIGFVNVEPYELHVTENGLQPRIDAEGRLVPVQAVLDYGIPVEPYLFLVDADGDVYAKFEGVVGSDELRAAIEDVLAEAA